MVLNVLMGEFYMLQDIINLINSNIIVLLIVLSLIFISVCIFVCYVLSKLECVSLIHKDVFERIKNIELNISNIEDIIKLMEFKNKEEGINNEGINDKFDVLFSDTKSMMEVIIKLNEKIENLKAKKVSSKRKVSKIKDEK
jgi:hypothetical protein